MEGGAVRLVTLRSATPRAFLGILAEQRSNIAGVEVEPPKLGMNGFGKRRALYEKPVVTDLGVKTPDVVLVGPPQVEQALGTKALTPGP